MNKSTISEIKQNLKERRIKNITQENIYYSGIIISIERLNLNNLVNNK